MTQNSEPMTKTAEAELASKLASVIQDFCDDLPRKDCERIGAESARAAWNAGVVCDEAMTKLAAECNSWQLSTQLLSAELTKVTAERDEARAELDRTPRCDV